MGVVDAGNDEPAAVQAFTLAAALRDFKRAAEADQRIADERFAVDGMPDRVGDDVQCAHSAAARADAIAGLGDDAEELQVAEGEFERPLMSRSSSGGVRMMAGSASAAATRRPNSASGRLALEA